MLKQYSGVQKALDPIAVSCATFAIGSVLIVPATVVTSPGLFTKLSASWQVGAIALALGTISTVVPTFCYSYAAKYLSPILTTALNLLTPVFAAAIAFFLLEEDVALISIFGAALIFGGIFLISTAAPTSEQTR